MQAAAGADIPTTLTSLSDSLSPITLSILTVSHPLLNPDPSSDTPQQAPALLAADLQHYADLFSKLRFSYVEQVTKERFLKAICSPDPEFVSYEQNVELEALLVKEKAALKERKEEVREVVGSIEAQGRSLVGRYASLTLEQTQLSSLPSQITKLQSTITHLHSLNPMPPSKTPESHTLPLQPTLDLLAARESQLADIDAEISRLRDHTIPGTAEKIDELKDTLGPLEMRKGKAVDEAREARRRREDGGRGDELEERGRWLRGVEGGLRGMLEV